MKELCCDGEDITKILLVWYCTKDDLWRLQAFLQEFIHLLWRLRQRCTVIKIVVGK